MKTLFYGIVAIVFLFLLGIGVIISLIIFPYKTFALQTINCDDFSLELEGGYYEDGIDGSLDARMRLYFTKRFKKKLIDETLFSSGDIIGSPPYYHSLNIPTSTFPDSVLGSGKFLNNGALWNSPVAPDERLWNINVLPSSPDLDNKNDRGEHRFTREEFDAIATCIQSNRSQFDYGITEFKRVGTEFFTKDGESIHEYRSFKPFDKLNSLNYVEINRLLPARPDVETNTTSGYSKFVELTCEDRGRFLIAPDSGNFHLGGASGVHDGNIINGEVYSNGSVQAEYWPYYRTNCVTNEGTSLDQYRKEVLNNIEQD